MSNDLDKAILKNLQVCAARKIFLEDIEDTLGEQEDVRTDINIPDVEIEENSIERFKRSRAGNNDPQEEVVEEETTDMLDPQAEFEKIRAEEHLPELEQFNTNQQPQETQETDLTTP